MKRCRSVVLRLSGVIIILAMLFPSCATDGRPAAGAPAAGAPPASGQDASSGEFRYGEAEIDTLSFQILESDPLRVDAVIQGFLADGCTGIDRIRVEREDELFRITVRTRRPADAICTQALRPFVERIALPLEGVPVGTYTIVAGDVRHRFVLE